jgi:hypothetical protein
VKLTKPVKKELAAILHDTLAAHLGDLALYHYRQAYELRDNGAIKMKGKKMIIDVRKIGAKK